jgi:hypothetical protein
MIPVIASGRTTNQRIAFNVPIGWPGWSPSSRLVDSANAGDTEVETKIATADEVDQMRRMLVNMLPVYDKYFSTRLRPMTSGVIVAKIEL